MVSGPVVKEKAFSFEIRSPEDSLESPTHQLLDVASKLNLKSLVHVSP